MDGLDRSRDSERPRMPGRLVAALFALVLLASPFIPLPGGPSMDASAYSLPSWERVFHLHEGAVLSSSYYDWMNSSDPYNPTAYDYDSDGLAGITLRKWNPSEHWRHFWVLDPAVGVDVHLVGDIVANMNARSRDNESGIMTLTFSDSSAAQLTDPAAWTLIGSVDVPLTGPVYSEFKLYTGTVTGVDYVLPSSHYLVLTAQRGDSVNDGLVIMYDQTMYDSYVTLETEDLISVGSVWTEDSSATARSVFSDAETVTVMANVSNPFGAYEIVGATAEVAFSGNGTTVVPSTAMALDVLDPSAVPYWAEFSLDLNGLASGDYIINVTAYDPQGAPTWLDAAFSVVSADHFGVTLPESVTAGAEFSMTVAALNASGSVITDWVGTVSLAAFLPDMATPGAGSLNISSVQITVGDLGQVAFTNQTYSYAEETIVVRAYAGVHEGWSSSMEVRAGPVVSVQIAPAGLIDVPAGGSQMFTAVGTDALGNTNTTWQPNWTLDGTAGSISGSGLTITFTASTAGTANLTCKDDESNASASVEITVVAGSLASMSVVPAGPLTIREGQSQTLTAYGYDSEGNPVPITGAAWSTDTSGSVVGTGPSAVYTAGFVPEVGSVEVAVGAIRAIVDITVINAMNGPWLSTLPIQIATEDSNWTFSLTTYWHHTNGTSDLRWFVEGVDTSLYIVLHDPDSVALMKFLTQPDAYGDDTFRLWVRDPDGFSAYQDVQVSIQSVNDRPRFVNNPPAELYVTFDQMYTFEYIYYVKDVDTPKTDLGMASSSANIFFDSLIATFLFPAKDGTNSYFEIVDVTVTDAASASLADETNSDTISLVVRVTDDTPPSLVEPLPDVTVYEGDMDVLVFDLDDYFFDIDDNFLVYSYGFHDIVIYINDTTHEVFVSAPTEWSGSTEGTLTATDPTGALKTDTIVVTVIAVNDPPAITSPGTVHVRYDVAHYLSANLYIEDPDHALDELTVEFGDAHATYVECQLVLLFPANLTGPTFTDPYLVRVSITVTDPLGAHATGSFLVLVSDDYPPTIATPVPYYDLFSFPEDTYLNGSLDLSILFEDQDDDGLAFFASNYTDIYPVIYDDGVVNFTAGVNWSGSEQITFMAVDPHGAWSSWMATVVVIPVNDAPVAYAIPDRIVTGGSRSMQYLLSSYFYDSETPVEELRIVVEQSANAEIVGGTLYVNLPDGIDVITVTVYAVDSDGVRSNEVTFEIGVKKTMAQLIGYPFSLPLVLLAAAVAGYFGMKLIPRPYALENVFLIHNDGRLIAHVTKEENTTIDKDVVSAMFTAVQEFVKDSFQQGEVGLKKLEIGDKSILIEKGRSVYIAMIYKGWPPKDVFETLTMLMRDIEERYKGRIERWNGMMKSLKGVEQMLQAYMSATFKPGVWQTEEDGMREEEWVDILDKEA